MGVDKMVKIRYLGTYKMDCIFKNFVGRLSPGDEIEIEKDIYDAELKTHKLWELVDTPKKKAGAKKTAEEK